MGHGLDLDISVTHISVPNLFAVMDFDLLEKWSIVGTLYLSSCVCSNQWTTFGTFANYQWPVFMMIKWKNLAQL